MALPFLFQPLPNDYPNRLASPTAERLYTPRRGRVIVGLLVACLLPRLLVAFWVPSVTPDGTVYIEQARLLEGGNVLGGLKGLSIYPAILAGMHRLGADWETGAKIWGVLMATLVVLPLYGWVRRQFDDRIALVACFFYIVHPKFITLSPEAIRDQTFWFLFAASLYGQWRAVVEVRLAWFLLAGLTTAFACLTRFEGLYLFLPMVLWSGWRWVALRGGRLRLAAGLGMFVAMLPAMVSAANLLWHQAHGEWFLPRLDPAGRAVAWLQGLLGRLTSDPSIPPMAAPPLSSGQMAWIFFPIMTRGLSPCFALLMFGGLWKWRRVWARRDHQAMFWTAMVFVLSSWIQLWFDRQLCFRYALPIVLMASPFAALGLLKLTIWLVGLVSRWWGTEPTQTAWQAPTRRIARPISRWATTWGPMAFVAVASLVSAGLGVKQTYAPRRDAAVLGLWLRALCGPGTLWVGPAGLTPVAAYYAAARCEPFRRDVENADEVVELVQRVQPQVVLVQTTRGLNREQCKSLVDRMKTWGWTPAVLPTAVQGHENLSVLLRREGWSSRAEAPASAATELVPPPQTVPSQNPSVAVEPTPKKTLAR